MNDLLLFIMSLIAIFVIYWVFAGQKKYNEMYMPKKKRKIKAIFFDLDGVILDSKEAWFNVFNQTRKKFKLKEISMDEFTKKVWGGSIEKDLKYFKSKTPEEIGKIYVNTFNKIVDKTKLIPKAEDVLKKIKQKKLKIGLVTNSYKKITNKVLKHHKILKYFDTVVCGDEVENDKPFPDEILVACERLKIRPEETVLVGDTKNDIKAGRAAGSFVIGYNIMADLKISSLEDLLELV